MVCHCDRVSQGSKTGFDIGAGNQTLEVVKLVAEISLQPWVYTILYFVSALYEQIFLKSKCYYHILIFYNDVL